MLPSYDVFTSDGASLQLNLKVAVGFGNLRIDQLFCLVAFNQRQGESGEEEEEERPFWRVGGEQLMVEKQIMVEKCLSQKSFLLI